MGQLYNDFFGNYGGKYVAEILRTPLDMLKEEFDFTAVYNGTELKKTTANMIEMQRWMSNLNGVEIIPLKLVTGLKRRYFLEVRALISSPRDLSSDNILFFYQESGPHQTDWHRSPLFSAGGQK